MNGKCADGRWMKNEKEKKLEEVETPQERKNLGGQKKQPNMLEEALCFHS